LFKKIYLVVIFCLSITCYGKSVILIDGTSGRVLYEDNGYQKCGMASTTKIMTAIIALENSKPNEIVTISNNSANTEGSSLYLMPNEKIKMGDLLYGLMLNSGNDAAVAIAEHISGNVDKFAELMNKKANEIGMTSSSFANPHGLDNINHYSTAYDMALLTKYALQNDKFKEIVGTESIIIEKSEKNQFRYLKNHNKLLDMYPLCIGVKTGFTKKCGRCLVSACKKDDMLFIAVSLNDPNDWDDHIKLYDNAFNNYKSYTIIGKNDYVCSSKVNSCNDDIVKLYAKDDIKLVLTNNEYKDIKLEYDYETTVTAPIYKGQKIGELKIKLKDDLVAKTDLITAYGLEKNVKSKYIENTIYLFNELLLLLQKSPI